MNQKFALKTYTSIFDVGRFFGNLIWNLAELAVESPNFKNFKIKSFN